MRSNPPFRIVPKWGWIVFTAVVASTFSLRPRPQPAAWQTAGGGSAFGSGASAPPRPPLGPREMAK